MVAVQFVMNAIKMGAMFRPNEFTTANTYAFFLKYEFVATERRHKIAFGCCGGSPRRGQRSEVDRFRSPPVH